MSRGKVLRRALLHRRWREAEVRRGRRRRAKETAWAEDEDQDERQSGDAA
jgi:hypothetical protein